REVTRENGFHRVKSGNCPCRSYGGRPRTRGRSETTIDGKEIRKRKRTAYGRNKLCSLRCLLLRTRPALLLDLTAVSLKPIPENEDRCGFGPTLDRVAVTRR